MIISFSILFYDNGYFLKEFAKLCCSNENRININMAYILHSYLLNMCTTSKISRQIYKIMKAVNSSPD